MKFITFLLLALGPLATLAFPEAKIQRSHNALLPIEEKYGKIDDGRLQTYRKFEGWGVLRELCRAVSVRLHGHDGISHITRLYDPTRRPYLDVCLFMHSKKLLYELLGEIRSQRNAFSRIQVHAGKPVSGDNNQRGSDMI